MKYILFYARVETIFHSFTHPYIVPNLYTFPNLYANNIDFHCMKNKWKKKNVDSLKCF